MRVLLVGPATSVHIQQWSRVLADRGLDIEVATIHPSGETVVPTHVLRPQAPAGYALAGRDLRRVIALRRPDLVHVHYVTGYGLLGRAVRNTPVVASAWGSDVMHFPTKSPFHRAFVRANLRRPTLVCVTSDAMKRAVAELDIDMAKVRVTAFGVDTARFTPAARDVTGDVPIVIGTVKTLDPIYGVDLLVRAVAAARALLPPATAARVRLVVVGDGPQRAELLDLSRSLGLAEVATFPGKVPHADVPSVLAGFDVFAALSRRESFGVAVLEASSTGLPVVVSDAGGLPEVVLDGRSGLVVPAGNVDAAAAAIADLVARADRRREMGVAGRSFVEERFSWPACAAAMQAVYDEAMRMVNPAR